MELQNKPFNLKSKNWFEKGKSRLQPYFPRFGSRRFWIVQAIIVVIAAIHDFVEVGGYLPDLGSLYFLPISIFILPVIYAALNFGLVGSLATVFWIIIVTIPNWVFFHYGLQRIGVMFQMLIFVMVAYFVGQRVDKEATARLKAETSGAALKSYMAYVVNVQEKERQRIARELHDQTIQMVVSLGRQLEGLLNHEILSSPVKEKLENARLMSDQIVNNLRDFAKELRPPALDDLGLVASISKLLLDFSDRSGIKSYLKQAGEERRLLPDTEVGLFRVVQEALRNIEIHSKASEVEVTIAFDLSGARLEVKDNGIGFDVSPIRENLVGNHFGLVGMRERAELFGGKFDVQSSPQKGTTITISIPAQQAGT